MKSQLFAADVSLFEVLENREFLSASLASNLRFPTTDRRYSSAARTAHTQYAVVKSAGKVSPNAGSGAPGGRTPAQIRKAYGADLIRFGSVVGDGTGQTIAIIDAYDDPSFVSSTSSNFAISDLHRFDQQFGLADPPSFTKVNQSGGTTYPAYNSGWSGEIALDVEWTHVMAPGAKIILVEATSASTSALNTAVKWAKQQTGVSAITMSYGQNEFSGETSSDSVFTTTAGHTGVTFLSSTGDSGSPGGYQAFSPNVVAVGGTSLSQLDSSGTYSSESAWSGSGGGISVYEKIPAYQKLITTPSATMRTIPDVSAVADPNTGVSVLETSAAGIGSAGGWYVYGGTSLSSPLWAGLIAVADQGRAQIGLSPLDGASQTLPRLYTLSASDFHDVTTGSNGGFSATAGDDAVTGRGSPIANQLIPDLAGGVTIAGTIYQDFNASGSLDSGESPVSGVSVYLDLNNNGAKDSNEPAATTSIAGTYTFSDLVGRTYSVREITPTGDVASSAAILSVNAAYGQTYTENFGVYPSFTSVYNGSSLTLKLDTTGTAIQVYNTADDITPNASIPKRLVSALSFTGTSGDDVLTIDLSNGNPLAGVSVSYDAAGHASTTGDALSIIGSTGQDGVTFSASTITIDGSTLNIANVQSTSFDGHGGFDTITDDASLPLTFAASQQFNSLSLGSSASAILAAGGNVLHTRALSLATGASLDLTDGGLIDDNAADLSSISGSLASGYNSGFWSGVGIRSSSAANDATKQHALGYATAGDVGITTLLGEPVSDASIIVRYTTYGDNTLDRTVDRGNDLPVLVAGLNGQATGWEGGDYNYDGVIDQNDFAVFIDALSAA